MYPVNTYFTLITGDFNVKFMNWSTIDTTTSEGAPLDFLITLRDVKQLTIELIHFLENSSCFLETIFTSQINIVMNSAIHPTLHASVITR